MEDALATEVEVADASVTVVVCVCVLWACVEDPLVELDVADWEAFASLSSSSLQSIGRSTALEVLLAKMPPVAPEASITDNAVTLEVQETTYKT